MTYLWRLLRRYLIEERGELMDNGIRLTAMGRLEALPEYVREALAGDRAPDRAPTRR